MLRNERPALLVSSTSWTKDEDFGILLDALVEFDAQLDCRLPFLAVVVTGKGPQKESYESRIAALNLNKVAVKTIWLEAFDYPKLLGSADLGVCLHTSTSGIDLPMKIWDMFGSGIPVCAVSFRCLNEVMDHGVNGYIFDNSSALAAQLLSVLIDFPRNDALMRLADGVSVPRWHESWVRNVLPTVLVQTGT